MLVFFFQAVFSNCNIKVRWNALWAERDATASEVKAYES